MSPSELESVYNDLSQVPQQTAEQAIGQLGQQQAAQGPSAAAMGASGGYGIGNYTYNRLVDPTVQQLSTQLVSTGRSQALNRAISLALSQAQENYRNAYNSYANRPSGNGGGGGDGGNGGGNGGDGTITGVDETVTDEMTPTNDVTGLGPIFATDGAQGVWDVGNDWVGIDTSTGGTVVPNIFGGDSSSGSSTESDKNNGRKFESAQAVKDYLENEIYNGYNGPLFFM